MINMSRRTVAAWMFSFFAAFSFMTVNAESPMLYGVKTYCGEGCSNGLYAIAAEANAQPELYWADGDMMGNGGAVYADGTLYVLSYLDFYGTLYWSYMVCDVENKTYEWSQPQLEFQDVGSAMTFDPTTGNIYSVCIDAYDTSKFTLSTMDRATGRKIVVAPIERMHVMAVDAKGVLYGIDAYGKLYTIDKNNAKTTLVGSTGVIPVTNQSAIIDYSTGVMYWSAYTDDGGALYTVDLATAEAKLLSTYDFQFVGLFLKQELKTEGAPRPVTDLSLDFKADKLTGNVNFTLPATDVDNLPIPGNVDYVVAVNGSNKLEGSAKAGSQVSEMISVPADGSYQFVVKAVNGNGESNAVNVSAWIGHDAPTQVENVTLAVDGSEATISWDIPAQGRNGGYVNPEKVKYQVVRGPYPITVADNLQATSFSDTFEIDGVQPLMYGVVALSGDYKSEMIVSNTVIVGDCFTPPFTEDLTDPFRQLVNESIDANGDECTWVYDDEVGTVRCNWPFADSSDDWLVLAPVRFEAGKTYKASVALRSEGRWNYDSQQFEDVYAGTLALMMGHDSNVESLTRTIIEPWDLSKRVLHTVESKPFTVDADGVYRLALHHTGARSIYYAYVHRIEVVPFDEANLADVDASTEAFKVDVEGDMLIVDNPQAQTIVVSTLDGRIVARFGQPREGVRLSSGVYIVSSGAQAVKVFVR